MADGSSLPPLLLVAKGQKVADEQGDIPVAASKGRDLDGHDIQAIEEVLAKELFLDQARQVLVRSCDNANVDLSGLG